MTPEEQFRKEAEELYPRADINKVHSDIEYHQLVGIVDTSRAAHIKARLKSHSEIEKLSAELEERDQLALEFADYLENSRWEYDYREQKTHTVKEHWEYFKATLHSPPKHN